jgi:cytochrome c-type biogenesis protein CcmH/NrfG
MDKHELIERYEARGDERDFRAAKPLYEQALAEAPTAQLLLEYGYLLECHGRNEVRRAVDQYRRAVELDPEADKARYQLIYALAGLFDREEMITLHRERLASAPEDIRELRFLASAYLAAGRHEQARTVIDAGLELAPDDRMLIAWRGEAKAAADDPEGALADWRHALELDDSDISPLYSSAFLLERERRLDEAADTWRSIVEWNERRGYDLSAEYPRRELERVRQKIAGT